MCAMVNFVFVIYLPEWINLRLHIIWLKHFHSRRIRDELAKQNEETTELTTKLDKVSKVAFICGLCYLTVGH